MTGPPGKREDRCGKSIVTSLGSTGRTDHSPAYLGTTSEKCSPKYVEVEKR